MELAISQIVGLLILGSITGFGWWKLRKYVHTQLSVAKSATHKLPMANMVTALVRRMRHRSERPACRICNNIICEHETEKDNELFGGR